MAVTRAIRETNSSMPHDRRQEHTADGPTVSYLRSLARGRCPRRAFSCVSGTQHNF